MDEIKEGGGSIVESGSRLDQEPKDVAWLEGGDVSLPDASQRAKKE